MKFSSLLATYQHVKIRKKRVKVVYNNDDDDNNNRLIHFCREFQNGDSDYAFDARLTNRPFLVFNFRSPWRSGLSARVPESQKRKMVG